MGGIERLIDFSRKRVDLQEECGIFAGWHASWNGTVRALCRVTICRDHRAAIRGIRGARCRGIQDRRSKTVISVLNSVSSLDAENALSSTSTSLQNTLLQLSTGLKINSGSDDAAGLSIASGLGANIAALTQSSQNASNGVGQLQTADGALSQVTTLLNRAVTLATEASNGDLTTEQRAAADTEFQSILSEIDQIGSTTNFNGTSVFTTAALTTFTSDGTSAGATTTSTTTGALSSTTLSLNTDALTSTTSAETALTAVTAAINSISATRGAIGASVNKLTADTSVEDTEVTNLTSAQNNVQNADIGKTVAKMTQYNVLEQTGMAALSQSNSASQNVLKLLQ
jgi:flagellin